MAVGKSSTAGTGGGHGPDGDHDAVVAERPAGRLEDAREAKVRDLDAPVLLGAGVLPHDQHVGGLRAAWREMRSVCMA